MRSTSLFAALMGEERGNVAMSFAVLLPAIVGVVGVGVDNAVWASQRNKLQAVADAAAFKAGETLTRGYTSTATARVDTSKSEAERVILAMVPEARRAVDVDYGAGTANVALTTSGLVGFAGLVGIGNVDISANARAVVGLGRADVCLLALDRQAPAGIVIGGSAKVSGRGCAVWSNATGRRSIVVGNRAQLDAAPVCAAGAASLGGAGPAASQRNLGASDCAPVADPLAAWAPPRIGPCTAENVNVVTGQNYTLTPGVYCGGLRIASKGSITFTPGVYVVRDGPMKLSAEVSITGSGVGILLAGQGATATIAAQVETRLTAATTGPLAGLLIASDRSPAKDRETATTTVMGGSSLDLDGTVYLPNQKLALAGVPASNQAQPVTQVIAGSIEIVGDGQFTLRTDFRAANMPVVSMLVPSVRIER